MNERRRLPFPASPRGRRLRRAALVVVFVVLGGVVVDAQLNQPQPLPPVVSTRLGAISLQPLPQHGKPLFTFVSMPDFLNADIGDVDVTSPAGPTAGINATWRKALKVALDTVREENPDFVLVAGDLVGGHWGLDWRATGAFGPVDTPAHRRQAITRAADLYYRQWLQRFQRRGLTVYPALGDHDIGDNPWPAGTFKLRSVPTYRQAFANHFTLTSTGAHRFPMRPRRTPWADTAYAVRVADTLIVSVDVFAANKDGVTQTVKGGQLRWLNHVMTRARRHGVRHIIVQGHTPVLTPVRMRHSSGLQLANGRESAFWQTLKRHDVDLYLCGEVHDMTTQIDQVVQVCHGGLMMHAELNYLVGRVYRDRIELELKEFDGSSDWTTRLWSTTRRRPPAIVTLKPHPRRVGTLVIDKRGKGPRKLRHGQGYLVPPVIPPAGPSVDDEDPLQPSVGAV